MKKIFVVTCLIVSIFVFAVACSSGDVMQQTEPGAKEDIKPYGQLVDVKGKKMNVLVKGDGEETIVWIPGYGDIAPGLSYTNMIEKLSADYRVVVVEPFGYGLSDLTDEPRTMENINEETHEVLAQLGIDEYHLMGHSIAGVYAMQYVNKYRDEVKSFTGIDTSTPNMLDGMMMSVEQDPDHVDPVPKIPKVSKDIQSEYKKISDKNFANKNLLDEDERMKENFEASKAYSFPKDLPVAFFLAKESVKNRKLDPSEHKDWVKMHTDLTKDSEYTETHTMKGDHLLYFTAYEEMSDKLKTFLDGAPGK